VKYGGGSEGKSRVGGRENVFEGCSILTRDWLAGSPLEELEAMLEPVGVGGLSFYPVGTRVGSVKNDDEGLLKELFLPDDGDDLPLFS
jgi:hypothetical protein